MAGIESIFLDIINKIYDAMGWPGVVFLMAIESAAIPFPLTLSQQLVAQGYYAASNPANSFFYMLTALHAVHLFGGLVAWGRTILKVWQGVEVSDVRMTVEMCAIYWHFLLVVWFVLFGLLLFT